MRTRVILLLVVLAGLLVAAGVRGSTAPVSLWGVVQIYKPGDMCGRGLDAYVEPCPGCTVWVDWMGRQPDNWVGRPYRLDGVVVDDFGTECQVLEVSNWTGCIGGPVGLSSESLR